MPCGITQCYLPPGSGENPALTPSRNRYSICSLICTLFKITFIVRWSQKPSNARCQYSVFADRSRLMASAKTLMLMQVKLTYQTSMYWHSIQMPSWKRCQRRSMTSVRSLVKSNNAKFFTPSPTFTRMKTGRRRSNIVDGIRRCATAVDRSDCDCQHQFGHY